MLFFGKKTLLVSFLSCNTYVRCQEIALNHDLVGRSVSSACTGTACLTLPSTSVKSTSTPVILSSSTRTPSSTSVSITFSARSLTLPISSTPSTAPSSKSTTVPNSSKPYALTTTFTQPPACTGGFTAIEDWGTQIYDNLILSSAGYNLTYTSCFPPQFYSSLLAGVDTTTLPAFTALICPATWENYAINSTYVVCCPSGYGLVAPNYDDPIRPGAGAACSSYIGGNQLMDITKFDLTGGQTVVLMTAASDGTVVWANAFDGLTTTGASTSASSSFSTTTSSHPLTFSTKVTSSSYHSPSSTTSTSKPNPFSSLPSSFVSSSHITITSLISSSKTLSGTTITGTAIPGESNLPLCGITCLNNVLAQYSTLGCNQLDSYCLCNNVNFGYGIRDCANAACGTAVASTVIAFGNAYCSSATATHVAAPTTSSTGTGSKTSLGTTITGTAIPGESNLPLCGITCFNNLLAQYSTLGCHQLDSYCLCSNVNFGYGIRDCANAACGTAVASTVIAFGNAYCSSATVTHVATSTSSTSRITTTTQPAMPISTDGRCGANVNGATCKGSIFGTCCSTKGNCGSTPAYCGVPNGCQPGYGSCSPVSTDGKCGSASSNNAMCLGSSFGDCCSTKGNCGKIPAYCGVPNGCQPGFGTCTPVSTDGKCGSASTVNAMCLGSTFGNCCSTKGNCGSIPAYCGVPNGCQPGFGNCTPVSTDGKCGAASSVNAMCLGSTFGDCCSTKGNCGTTSAFCASTNGCQPSFGTCTA